jgi:lipooligosaccharide transport system permease protein
LFSATFYPLTAYPDGVQTFVRWTPLYQGVVLARGMALGSMGWEAVTAVAYLTLLGLVGVYVASRRLGSLLLK